MPFIMMQFSQCKPTNALSSSELQ